MLRHFLLIFLCIYSSAANAAWYNPAWNYRTKITIQASSVNGTVTELPVFVDLSHLPGSFFDNVSANGADLRVTSSDGSTEIAREVVSLSKTANTGELWFKAPSLSSAANTEFYIYYGNNTASEPLANSTFGSQNVWSNGFVAVYHMNAVTNGTASVLDSTSSAYHGTPRGGMATLGSGIAGNAIAFDGSNDFISSGIAFSNPERTICSWVNHTNKDTPGTQRYLSLTNEANVLRQQAAGFTQYMFNQSAVFYGASENSTVNNTWYYFCGVWDASTGLAYRNANQVISYAFTGLPRNVGSLSISTGAETMNGRIDEVKISTKARNRNWIQTEYNNQNSPLSFYTLSAEQGSLTEFPHRLNVTINASQVNGSV
ncbi:MAG: DUF2341 domain-containing protein, partial [Candidatus Caenarcaniphilales bacterium]|nr:DUF2341 domain-containing protein [Candidatus Caenarcaniphilales bacterium]